MPFFVFFLRERKERQALKGGNGDKQMGEEDQICFFPPRFPTFYIFSRGGLPAFFSKLGSSGILYSFVVVVLQKFIGGSERLHPNIELIRGGI